MLDWAFQFRHQRYIRYQRHGTEQVQIALERDVAVIESGLLSRNGRGWEGLEGRPL